MKLTYIRLLFSIIIIALSVLLCCFYKAHVCASQASLSISSIPAGASILLDNEDTGFITHHSFSQVDQGVHTITLSAEGIQDTSFSFQLGDENLSVEFMLFRDKKGQAYFKETVNLDYMPNCTIEYYYFIPDGFEKQAVRPVIITLHGTQGSDGNDDEARRSTGKMLDLWIAQKPLEPGAYRNVRNIDGQETGFAIASVRWWYDISCWDPNSDRNDRYLTYHELAQTVVEVVMSLYEKGVDPKKVLLHGLSRGSERSWAVTFHINSNTRFRQQYISPWEELTDAEIKIALTFPHAGACQLPCQQEIEKNDGSDLSACHFFPYAGNADHIEYSNETLDQQGEHKCGGVDDPSAQDNYYWCPWRMDYMIASRDALIPLRADVAIPRLGNICLNDDVIPEDRPLAHEHELTRVYPGLAESHYQGPDDCAHGELDDDVIDELFEVFERCMDGDCYICERPDGDVAPLGARDGTVNVGDSLVALRFALELETPAQADINHGDVAPLGTNDQPEPDGHITVGDALVILRKALGLISLSY